MGSESNLSLKRSVTIGTMINFAGDFDGHGHGDGTCKQALIHQTATYPRTGCHDMTPVKKIITISP